MAKQPSADYLKYNLDEFQESVDIAALEEFAQLLQSQPKKLYSESRHRRQIQKVPPQIRQRVRRSDQLYDPVMVSLGPYHHAKPELRRAEEFKHLCLDLRAGGNEEKKALLYSKILEDIESIRDSYAEVSVVKKYDDQSLALMMLLDASIVIDFMHNFIGMKGNSFLGWQRCLGAGSGPLMVRDMMLMENQIPFRVLKLLISLQYEREEAALFLPRFMSIKMRMDMNPSIPQEDEDPPVHLLEAVWRVLVTKHGPMMSERSNSKNRFLLSGFSMREESNFDTDISYTHRSIMDLKAKGIRVRPNSTRPLQDVRFRPSASASCFSELELPIQYVSDLTPVVWSNLIAFEVLPNNITSLVVLSYAIFLKSLIQRPEDVKELQERGIVLNRPANHEKVVEIEEHCKSRARIRISSRM